MKNTKKNIDLRDAMNDLIRKSINGRRRKSDGFKVSKGTIRNYQNTRRLLEVFCTEKQTQWEIDSSMKPSASQYRKRKAYWEKFWRQFSAFLYTRGCHDNYVSSLFKTIRCVLRYMHQTFGYADHHFLPHHWIRSEQPEFPVIGAEQLRTLIYDQSLYRNLSPRLKKIRRIMITGCLTALRASDLLNLRGKNLIEKDTQRWLIVTSQKTKQQTRMLLPPPLAEILTPKRNPSARLLPQLSNVNLNIGIKTLAEKAGWTWTVPCFRKKMGIPVARDHQGTHDQSRFCDQLTTHSLRRSAITLLLRAGMSETLVRKISGHQPGSREFHRYVSVSQDWLDEETTHAFDLVTAPTKTA
jgi:integrase